jgi:hypothetical protein
MSGDIETGIRAGNSQSSTQQVNAFRNTFEFTIERDEDHLKLEVSHPSLGAVSLNDVVFTSDPTVPFETSTAWSRRLVGVGNANFVISIYRVNNHFNLAITGPAVDVVMINGLPPHQVS